MNTKNLNEIQNVLDTAVNTNFLAGTSVLVYKDGKEIGYWQAGKADIENNKAFNRDTICRMYSMTKPVTCVAAMILVEEGKLDLGEEIANYLPSFWNLQISYDKGKNGKTQKTWRNILVQDLLNMTSGYTYGAWSEDCPYGEHLTSDLIQELNADAAGPNKITTQDVAERLSKIPVSFEPGTDYSYGLSADILGALIEKVSGMKFSEFLKKRIFDPLGMKDTAFYVPDEKQNRLAKAYRCVKTDNVQKLELHTYCNLGIQDKMDHAPAFESGGAGLCSTIDDYMKFARMLTNSGEIDGVRILRKATVDFLRHGRLRDDLQQKFNQKMGHLSGYTYCNLLRVAYEPEKSMAITDYEEFGWDGWLGPYVSVDIKNQLTIVMMMQRCDSGTTSYTRKMKNIVYSNL